MPSHSDTSRPLLITDCDEVILYMMVPFAQWLDEEHAINCDLQADDLAEMLRHRDTGDLVDREQVWPLFEQFFAHEMHRQSPFAGAIEALKRIQEIADIVVLTNTGATFHDHRKAQLAGYGLDLPIYANSGSKGPVVARIIAEYQPSVAIFIDDLPHHLKAAGEHAPQCWRLHMVGEPEIAANVPPCPEAHARIDNWAEAEPWLTERLLNAQPAPPIAPDLTAESPLP